MKILKVETSVPVENADELRLAIGKAGGGAIGNYQYTCFLTPGKGYFMPLDSSNPVIGKHNEISEVDEVKLEFFCEEDKLEKVIETIKDVHPYEKPWLTYFEVAFCSDDA